MGDYDQGPADMAAQLETFLDKGLVNVLGGCCGTTPDHIQAIAELVKGHSPRRIPQTASTTTSTEA